MCVWHRIFGILCSHVKMGHRGAMTEIYELAHVTHIPDLHRYSLKVWSRTACISFHRSERKNAFLRESEYALVLWAYTVAVGAIKTSLGSSWSYWCITHLKFNLVVVRVHTTIRKFNFGEFSVFSRAEMLCLYNYLVH